MKVVIAGSAKLPIEIERWVDYWNKKNNCEVLNFPKQIPAENFEQIYPEVHVDFFKNIIETDILFVANEEKNNILGYIGAETFAELSFGLTQKLIYNKKIKLILAHMPSQDVSCYNEIVLWLKLGWIDEILN